MTQVRTDKSLAHSLICALSIATLATVGVPISLAQSVEETTPSNTLGGVPTVTFRILYSFQNGTDGANPTAGLVQDTAGNLYGTTNSGYPSGFGTVFKLDKSGHETVLHAFNGGKDGANPGATLLRDEAGNLYGTASGGGAHNAGTVFKLDAKGRFSVLYTFTGSSDGAVPLSTLIRDGSGNLYGTTLTGGDLSCELLGYLFKGCGTVFKLDPNGQETVLHSFLSGSDGAAPQAGLVGDANGNLYGTAYYGGNGPCYDGYAHGCGVVFKVDANDRESVLHRFKGGAGGGNPAAPLIRDAAGNLYGTTLIGGTSPWGTIFKLNSAGKFTVLYSFTGGLDGASPYAGLVQDRAANLYGEAYEGGGANAGTIFKLDAAGELSVLHSFDDGATGSNPLGGLLRDGTGNLYGTTPLGGTVGVGMVFKLRP